VLFGDWRTYYDAVRVVRAGELEGRRIYVVRLESAGLPPIVVSVDAPTGDVLREQRTVAIPVGGGLPITTTYSDYRDLRGTRVPYRYVESNEQTGRTIYQVESVDVGVRLDPDIFTLQRPMPSGRWQGDEGIPWAATEEETTLIAEAGSSGWIRTSNPPVNRVTQV
jgi:hypothetical protein